MIESKQLERTPRVFVHIGTHRTGSTTLQTFLGQYRKQLLAVGIDYYRGSILPDNHIELYLSTLDPNKDTLAKSQMDLSLGEEFASRTRQEIHGFLGKSRAGTVIFSTEGLSLLREPEEMERLGQLFDPGKFQVTIVLVLRNRKSYLASYRRQILKTPGRVVSRDPKSALYVEHDSWLADFDRLINAYTNLYQSENIRILDYDYYVSKSGDMLPAVLDALSVPAHLIPLPGVVTRENHSSWRVSVKGLFLRLFGQT